MRFGLIPEANGSYVGLLRQIASAMSPGVILSDFSCGDVGYRSDDTAVGRHAEYSHGRAFEGFAQLFDWGDARN
jgi:hypothetical protein